MVRYIKCPRCELNYIDGDTQEYCDVCVAEMKGNKLKFADLDDEELEEELEAEASELCPVCGVNYIKFGEKMCEACRKNSEYEEDDTPDPDQDDEWKNYLDDDTDDLNIGDDDLEEELSEELDGDDEEEESNSEYKDEFDDEDVDSLSDLEDDEFDDDEDDDDDDDDDLF
jgi:hypothetical protein